MSRADSLAATDKQVQDFVVNGEVTEAEITAGEAQGSKWFSLRRLRMGFSISLTPNGFLAFPAWLGGLILQWGTNSTINGTVTVTLPVTCPTKPLLVTGHESSVTVSQTGAVRNDTLTSSTFQIVSNAASSFSWIHLGH